MHNEIMVKNSHMMAGRKHHLIHINISFYSTMQDIVISFFLAAGHNVGTVLLTTNVRFAYSISSNSDDVNWIVNAMFSSAVRLISSETKWLTLAVSSCRHSAPMPPTCLSFWQCI